jgi:hypothetical protein
MQLMSFMGLVGSEMLVLRQSKLGDNSFEYLPHDVPLFPGSRPVRVQAEPAQPLRFFISALLNQQIG